MHHLQPIEFERHAGGGGGGGGAAAAAAAAQVYAYRHGFARFTTVNYSNEAHDLDNEFMHLTNVAIQKHADGYSNAHGGKWSLRNLQLYVEGTRGAEAANKLMADIGWVIVHSLKACQNVRA